jgi:YHYH protein
MKFDKRLIATFALIGLGIVGYASTMTSSAMTSSAMTSSAMTSSAMTSSAMTSSAMTSSANPLDPTRLPIGDGKVSASPRVGYVFSCQTRFPPAGGAFRDGPWIKPDGTFDFTAKAIVDGRVAWTSSQTITLEKATNTVTGNGLPKHPTGTFPVASSDDAYQFDRNPNPIKAQSIRFKLPANPLVADKPNCLSLGPIGITLTGVVIFNALDGNGKDAVAHELQDACQGHPERSGQYHYHNLTSCLNDSGTDNSGTGNSGTGHSSLQGYMLDGFGLYGLRGETGHILTNADLDECHGHTHQILWNGKPSSMYHYHATQEYPYTVSCFKGTPSS